MALRIDLRHPHEIRFAHKEVVRVTFRDPGNVVWQRPLKVSPLTVTLGQHEGATAVVDIESPMTWVIQ